MQPLGQDAAHQRRVLQPVLQRCLFQRQGNLGRRTGMLSTTLPDPAPVPPLHRVPSLHPSAVTRPCPATPRYLGQPGLLGLLELEDTTGLQEGDKGQTLGLVDGGELLPPAHLAVGVVELGRAGGGHTAAKHPRDTPGTPTHCPGPALRGSHRHSPSPGSPRGRASAGQAGAGSRAAPSAAAGKCPGPPGTPLPAGPQKPPRAPGRCAGAPHAWGQGTPGTHLWERERIPGR